MLPEALLERVYELPGLQAFRFLIPTEPRSVRRPILHFLLAAWSTVDPPTPGREIFTLLRDCFALPADYDPSSEPTVESLVNALLEVTDERQLLCPEMWQEFMADLPLPRLPTSRAPVRLGQRNPSLRQQRSRLPFELKDGEGSVERRVGQEEMKEERELGTDAAPTITLKTVKRSSGYSPPEEKEEAIKMLTDFFVVYALERDCFTLSADQIYKVGHRFWSHYLRNATRPQWISWTTLGFIPHPYDVLHQLALAPLSNQLQKSVKPCSYLKGSLVNAALLDRIQQDHRSSFFARGGAKRMLDELSRVEARVKDDSEQGKEMEGLEGERKSWVFSDPVAIATVEKLGVKATLRVGEWQSLHSGTTTSPKDRAPLDEYAIKNATPLSLVLSLAAQRYAHLSPSSSTSPYDYWVYLQDDSEGGKLSGDELVQQQHVAEVAFAAAIESPYSTNVLAPGLPEFPRLPPPINQLLPTSVDPPPLPLPLSSHLAVIVNCSDDRDELKIKPAVVKRLQAAFEQASPQHTKIIFVDSLVRPIPSPDTLNILLLNLRSSSKVPEDLGMLLSTSLTLTIPNDQLPLVFIPTSPLAASALSAMTGHASSDLEAEMRGGEFVLHWQHRLLAAVSLPGPLASGRPSPLSNEVLSEMALLVAGGVLEASVVVEDTVRETGEGLSEIELEFEVRKALREKRDGGRSWMRAGLEGVARGLIATSSGCSTRSAIIRALAKQNVTLDLNDDETLRLLMLLGYTTASGNVSNFIKSLANAQKPLRIIVVAEAGNTINLALENGTFKIDELIFAQVPSTLNGNTLRLCSAGPTSTSSSNLGSMRRPFVRKLTSANPNSVFHPARMAGLAQLRVNLDFHPLGFLSFHAVGDEDDWAETSTGSFFMLPGRLEAIQLLRNDYVHYRAFADDAQHGRLMPSECREVKTIYRDSDILTSNLAISLKAARLGIPTKKLVEQLDAQTADLQQSRRRLEEATAGLQQPQPSDSQRRALIQETTIRHKHTELLQQQQDCLTSSSIHRALDKAFAGIDISAYEPDSNDEGMD